MVCVTVLQRAFSDLRAHRHGAQRPIVWADSWKRMKMWVAMVGTGKMRIYAAFSYDACATKHRARYS